MQLKNLSTTKKKNSSLQSIQFHHTIRSVRRLLYAMHAIYIVHFTSCLFKSQSECFTHFVAPSSHIKLRWSERARETFRQKKKKKTKQKFIQKNTSLTWFSWRYVCVCMCVNFMFVRVTFNLYIQYMHICVLIKAFYSLNCELLQERHRRFCCCRLIQLCFGVSGSHRQTHKILQMTINGIIFSQRLWTYFFVAFCLFCNKKKLCELDVEK